jgi:circadian clock protein KaiC
LFTSLTDSHSALENTDVGISSLIDTWLLLRDIELNGERNRGMYVLKSRGMANSNQIREFILTKHGVDYGRLYGPAVLTFSMHRKRKMPKFLMRKQTLNEKRIEQKETLKATLQAGLSRKNPKLSG